ncbi:MAG: hypothetical protein J7480_09455, partial [Microbacteriaceae bacterium]|nr:hypothetical protein [Microbacteriaceae bacterium]
PEPAIAPATHNPWPDATKPPTAPIPTQSAPGDGIAPGLQQWDQAAEAIDFQAPPPPPPGLAPPLPPELRSP